MSAGTGIRALLACDLDGTLLDEEGEPAPGIVEVLAELRAAGAPLAVCTGRPLFSAQRAAKRLETEPVVYMCYHGALVVDAADGRHLRHLPLPQAEASALVAEALGRGLGVTVYDVDDPRETRTGSLGPLVTRLVLYGDPELAARLLPDLVGRWNGRLRVEPIRPGFIGVFNAHADKGDAVRLVAAHLGVPLERAVACGDSENDESLLRVAGVRVAVGDAPPALRRLTPVVVLQTDLATTLRTLVASAL